MKDWDGIGCPNGRPGRRRAEAMPRMTRGELDAGKPPVPFDAGRRRANETDHYGRFNSPLLTLPTLLTAAPIFGKKVFGFSKCGH